MHRPSRPLRRVLASCALCASAVLAAAPAQAGPDVLKRSLGNILFAPIDLVLSPFVGAHTLYNNLRDVDDSVGVRVVYVPLGFCWNTGVQALGAVTREISGLLELLPGIGLFFLETDMDPLFAPPERGNSLLNVDNEIFPVKIGVDYMTVPF